jgi:hypothetical protein
MGGQKRRHLETHYHLVVELHPYSSLDNGNLGLGCGLSIVTSLCVVTIP